MKRLSPRAKWVLGGVLFVAFVVAGSFFTLLHSKVRTASRSEILAAIPKELLAPVNRDETAIKRFTRLVEEVHRVKKEDLTELQMDLGPGPSSLASAKRLYVGQAGVLHNIDTLISSGEVEEPERSSSNTQSEWESVDLGELTKLLTASGKQFAAIGDFTAATDCFLLAIRLANSCDSAVRSCWRYFVASLHERIALNEIGSEVTKHAFPAEDCRRLLRALPPSADFDNQLEVDILDTFQSSIVPALQDPTKEYWAKIDGITVGNYEPIVTATKAGTLYLEALKDVRVPYSEMNFSAMHDADRDRRWLPQYPSDSFQTMLTKAGISKSVSPEDKPLNKTLRKWFYRFAMNRIPNSLGRMLVADNDMIVRSIDGSSQTRALREALRALLAIRLFMADHAGTPPPNLQALVPTYLDRIPRDPFDGKPLTYDLVARSVSSRQPDTKSDRVTGFSFGK